MSGIVLNKIIPMWFGNHKFE